MRYVALTISVALMVFSAGPAVAQVNCGKLSYFACSGPPAHENPATGNTLGSPIHSGCMYCPSQDGIFACHDECNETHNFGLLTASVYASLVAAATNDDVRTVLALAPHARDFVRFNAARGSIQILSCTREELISSLRVRGAILLVAQAALLDADHEATAAGPMTASKQE